MKRTETKMEVPGKPHLELIVIEFIMEKGDDAEDLLYEAALQFPEEQRAISHGKVTVKLIKSIPQKKRTKTLL